MKNTSECRICFNIYRRLLSGEHCGQDTMAGLFFDSDELTIWFMNDVGTGYIFHQI